MLENVDARGLPHKEIARRMREESGVSGSWAQSIAVAYEQDVCQRVPGQQCDGKFQVSVTKTISASMNTVLARWQAAMAGRKKLAGIAITRGPAVSRTDKWRYWCCSLADGSRVSVGIGNKDSCKAMLGVGHDRLDSPQAVKRWRAFWKAELAAL